MRPRDRRPPFTRRPGKPPWKTRNWAHGVLVDPRAPKCARLVAQAILHRHLHNPQHQRLFVGYGGRRSGRQVVVRERREPGLATEGAASRSSAIRGVAWLVLHTPLQKIVGCAPDGKGPGGRGYANSYHLPFGEPEPEPEPEPKETGPLPPPEVLDVRRQHLQRAVAQLIERRSLPAP